MNTQNNTPTTDETESSYMIPILKGQSKRLCKERNDLLKSRLNGLIYMIDSMIDIPNGDIILKGYVDKLDFEFLAYDINFTTTIKEYKNKKGKVHMAHYCGSKYLRKVNDGEGELYLQQLMPMSHFDVNFKGFWLSESNQNIFKPKITLDPKKCY